MPSPQNRGVNNTAFSFNPDKVAQTTNSGQPVPGSCQPTYAATVSVDQVLQYSTYVRIPGLNATSATCTVSSAFVGNIGADITIACVSTGAGTVTYTFGTGFKPSGTAAATTLTSMSVSFRSNGTNWEETGRSLAIAF